MTAPEEAGPLTSYAVAGIIDRGNDLQVHVRTMEVDGEKFTDIREFVPSNDTYGRGVMIPFALTKPVMKALMDAARSG